MNRNFVRKFILVLIAFVVYSISTVLTKLASQHQFLSLQYVIYSSGLIITLGIYAILWQKVLTFMPLNKAFLCKSITIPIILTFSSFLFSEQITLNNLIGAAFIILGLVVLSWKK